MSTLEKNQRAALDIVSVLPADVTGLDLAHIFAYVASGYGIEGSSAREFFGWISDRSEQAYAGTYSDQAIRKMKEGGPG